MLSYVAGELCKLARWIALTTWGFNNLYSTYYKGFSICSMLHGVNTHIYVRYYIMSNVCYLRPNRASLLLFDFFSEVANTHTLTHTHTHTSARPHTVCDSHANHKTHFIRQYGSVIFHFGVDTTHAAFTLTFSWKIISLSLLMCGFHTTFWLVASHFRFHCLIIIKWMIIIISSCWLQPFNVIFILHFPTLVLLIAYQFGVGVCVYAHNFW